MKVLSRDGWRHNQHPLLFPCGSCMALSRSQSASGFPTDVLLKSCGAEKFVVSTDGSSFSGLGDDQEGHACNQTDADNSFKDIGSCPIHGSPGVAGHGVSHTSSGGVTGLSSRHAHGCNSDNKCQRSYGGGDADSSLTEHGAISCVGGGDVGSGHWFEL